MMSASSAGTADRRRISSDILVQTVGYALNLALGVAVTLIVVRTLGERGYGEWATLLVVWQLVGYIADPGVEQAAVRAAAKEPQSEPSWLGALVSLRTALTIPAAAVYVVVVLLIANGSQMRAAGLILIGLVLLYAPAAFGSIFQLRVRNDLSILLLSVNSLVWAGAVVLVATQDGGIVPLAAALVVVTAMTDAARIALALPRTSLEFAHARRLWSRLARAGLPIGIATALILAYGKIDQLLVLLLAGAKDAGLYGAVYRILSQGTLIPFAVVTTLFPIVAASRAMDIQRLRTMLQGAADYLSAVTFAALPFAIVAAKPVVRLLFGSDFEEAAPALPILMAAFVPISFCSVTIDSMLALGLQRKLIGYASVLLALNVGLNLAFIPSYGFLAAAWITLGTGLVALGLTFRGVRQETGFQPALGRMVRSAAAATGLGLVLWGLREAGVGLAGLAGAAVVLYPSFLFLTRALRPRELVALFRRTEAPV